jgi:hypothetical protein
MSREIRVTVPDKDCNKCKIAWGIDLLLCPFRKKVMYRRGRLKPTKACRNAEIKEG